MVVQRVGRQPADRKVAGQLAQRGLPLFTFINKLDRPGQEPLALMDEIENILGIPADQILRISAKSGEGVPELLDAVPELRSSIPAVSPRMRLDPTAALAAPAPPLKFRLGPVPRPAAEVVVPPPPRAAVEAAERLAAQVEDGPLRDAVEAALRRAPVRSGDLPDSA